VDTWKPSTQTDVEALFANEFTSLMVFVTSVGPPMDVPSHYWIMAGRLHLYRKAKRSAIAATLPQKAHRDVRGMMKNTHLYSSTSNWGRSGHATSCYSALRASPFGRRVHKWLVTYLKDSAPAG
jgi:hypothetical protein